MTTVPDSGTCRVVERIVDLSAFREADCNSVVLRGSPGIALPAEDRDALLANLNQKLRLDVLADGRADQTLDASLRAMGCSDVPAAQIREWTKVVCELTGSIGCTVKLQRADRQMCPWFHSDRVSVRLLVTWCGTTTEVVTTPNYVEQFEADPTTRQSGAGAEILRPEVGDFLLMKGSLWPENTVGACVHRSPDVADGEARLVVTWDPFEPETGFDE